MRFYTLGFFLFLITNTLLAQPYFNSCGPDTVRYAQAKSSGSFEYTLNTQSTILGYSQFYDAPQGITVSGFCFYGRAIGNTSNTLTVTGNLYDFNPIDSLPFGAPLVQGTVQVDTSYHNGNMNLMKYIVQFNVPITMYNGFVLAVETDGSMPLKIYGNVSGDGGFERLSLAKYSGYWHNMLEFAADIDFYLEPIVEYSLGAEITITQDSVCAPGTFYMAGAAPGVTLNRMYNQRAFNNQILNCFNWNVEGTTLPHTLDTFYNITPVGPVVVTLTDSIVGWTTNCTVTATDTVHFMTAPVANYNTIGYGLSVAFIADTPNALDFYWDFGDGTTGYGDSLGHTYPLPGTYTICMIAENVCLADTVCATFVLPYVGVDEQLAQVPHISVYPNPAVESTSINYTGANPIAQLQVYTITGALVYGETPTAQNGVARLNLQGYAPGLYFIRITDEKGLSTTEKLIVAQN